MSRSVYGVVDEISENVVVYINRNVKKGDGNVGNSAVEFEDRVGGLEKRERKGSMSWRVNEIKQIQLSM